MGFRVTNKSCYDRTWEEFQQRTEIAYKWSHPAPGALEVPHHASARISDGLSSVINYAFCGQFLFEPGKWIETLELESGKSF